MPLDKKKKKKNKKWYRAELAKTEADLRIARAELDLAKEDATTTNAVIAPIASACEGVFDEVDDDRPIFIYTIVKCGGSDLVSIPADSVTVKNIKDLTTL